jgi:hypothetical protein
MTISSSAPPPGTATSAVVLDCSLGVTVGQYGKAPFPNSSGTRFRLLNKEKC